MLRRLSFERGCAAAATPQGMMPGDIGVIEQFVPNFPAGFGLAHGRVLCFAEGALEEMCRPRRTEAFGLAIFEAARGRQRTARHLRASGPRALQEIALRGLSTAFVALVLIRLF